MIEQWHDWMFCECCGFWREVLVSNEPFDGLDVECTVCGFAWVAPEPEDPGAGPQTPQP